MLTTRWHPAGRLIRLVLPAALCLWIATGTFHATPADPEPAPLIEWISGSLPAALPLAAAHYDHSAENNGLTVAVPRLTADPGERWIEILLGLKSAFFSKDAAPRLAVSLHPIDAPGSAPVDQRLAPEAFMQGALGDRILLRVDLRRAGLQRARLRLILSDAQDRLLAVEEVLLSAQPPKQPLLSGQRIPVRLDPPPGSAPLPAWPVVFGIPFPPGALWDSDGLRIVNDQGTEVPSQMEITGRWAEAGSIQWLRCDALADSERALFVEAVAAGPGALPATPLHVEEHGERLVIDTGAARFELDSSHSPIKSMQRAGGKAVHAAPEGLYVVDQLGRRASAGPMEVRIEARGPVAAAVRFEGFYETDSGEPVARHITRIEAHTGRPDLRVLHTLVLTRDTNELWFREIGWAFAVDAGPRAKASFAAARADWGAGESVVLTDTVTAAYLLQADHEQFGGGENLYRLALLAADGSETTLLQGAEMGDWAALQGANGGLAVACREAARQHPKEFLLERERVTLKLFSPRAGEELDFRPAALAARWNRGGLLTDVRGRVVGRGESLAPRVAATATSAVGWSKTHQIMLKPLRSDTPGDAIRTAARVNSEPLYALADPAWLYATRALGPLYPRDPERFPGAEAVLDAALEPYFERGHERAGEYGFIDYFAGPHYRGMGQYRYPATYALRPALWLNYARSGNRRIRAFASGTTRAYMDNLFCHWADEDSGKTRGLTNRGSGIKMMLPYYWGDGTLVSSFDGPAWACHFMLYYQLGGYRRARDVIEQYADGLMNAPATHTWYRSRGLRNMAVPYLLTWDPDLRLMIEERIQAMHDPESAVATRREIWPHQRVLYKTPEHLPIPIMYGTLLGDRRLTEIAHGWARANLYGYSYAASRLGSDPLTGRFEKGLTSWFVYQQEGRAHLAEEMLFALWRSIPGRSQTISSINYDILGIAYGLALIDETGVDRVGRGAWLAYELTGSAGDLRVFVRKQDAQPLDAYGLHLTGAQALRPARARLWWSTGAPPAVTHLHLPKDSDDGDYELLTRAEPGEHTIFTDGRQPLVLYAAGAWQPGPREAMAWPPIYFRLPDDARQARIYFEGSARLIAPDGAPWPDDAAHSGWIDLDSQQPGLWAFVPIDNQTVQTENIPPFFAFRDPEYHFIPERMEPDNRGEERDDD